MGEINNNNLTDIQRENLILLNELKSQNMIELNKIRKNIDEIENIENDIDKDIQKYENKINILYEYIDSTIKIFYTICKNYKV